MCSTKTRNQQLDGLGSRIRSRRQVEGISTLEPPKFPLGWFPPLLWIDIIRTSKHMLGGTTYQLRDFVQEGLKQRTPLVGCFPPGAYQTKGDHLDTLQSTNIALLGGPGRPLSFKADPVGSMWLWVKINGAILGQVHHQFRTYFSGD